MNPSRRLTAAHRRGEIDIQAQLIGWQHMARWVHALDAGRWRRAFWRTIEHLLERRTLTRLAKDRAIADARRQWILRSEHQRAIFDSVVANQRRHVRRVNRHRQQ